MSLERLQKTYPFLRFERGSWEGHYTVHITDHSQFYINESPTSDELCQLNRYNSKERLRAHYMKLYPNLVITINEDNGLPDGLWVKRGDTSGECILIDLQGISTAVMNKYNFIAGEARKPGWFYCSRCGQAKPETEYAYFYFAGKYCNKCKFRNPKHYAMAMRESYN